MKGSYEVTIQNRRLRYRFTVFRNLTILRGDSATGKTTLIEMLRAHQAGGSESGITVVCKKPCLVLGQVNWKENLALMKDSIVFIDEGASFITTQDFAAAAKDSSNYYVIATRYALPNLPYSVTEIYGIKNRAGNRYQGTKRIYSTFYPLYQEDLRTILRPDLVVTEDSNSGFTFFSHVCRKYGIECICAGGKSNIYQTVAGHPAENILVIADGAAFGPEIEMTLSIRKVKNVGIYLPESFEWMILKSGLFKDRDMQEMLEEPSKEIESSRYFSWEQFFTELLVQKSQGTYLQYRKTKLNPVYLQEREMETIKAVMPEINGLN